MSELTELNQAVASVGGSWVKLQAKGDVIEGEITAFEKRPRTDPQGNVVMKRGTDTPRIEWLFTLKVDADQLEGPDDDGLRKLPANESMQRAIASAIKEAGVQAEVGGRLKVGVKADRPDDFSQAEYQAKYTAPMAKLDVNVDEAF